MGIKKFGPYTPSRRNMTGLDYAEITKSTPEKSLCVSLKKNSGRNNQGKITVRHRGGGSRRLYRIIDFKRRKDGIPAKVVKVNTVNADGKVKRRGVTYGRTAKTKKAYVKLSEDSKDIEIFQGL